MNHDPPVTGSKAQSGHYGKCKSNIIITANSIVLQVVGPSIGRGARHQ